MLHENTETPLIKSDRIFVEEFREVMIDGIQNADVVENKVDHNPSSGAVIQGSYYAAGAVNYAHEWAYSRNPEFYDFGTVDCTNFVSQAMNRGGHIPMTAEQGGIGTSGWYYVNVNNRAVAWTWAPSLYNFIVNQENPTYFPGKGPKGYSAGGFSNLSPGDLIFYNIVNQPQIQDHVVMVVQWSAYQPLVAGHSPNVDYYPYDVFNYSQAFLIHITGF